jgi:hypothetical protein
VDLSLTSRTTVFSGVAKDWVMELAIGLAILAGVIILAAVVRRVDASPKTDDSSVTVTPVLLYHPRSFKEPAVKGFTRDVSRYRQRPRGDAA